jgi:hypothetical protein
MRPSAASRSTADVTFKRTLLVRELEEDMKIDVAEFIRIAYFWAGLTDQSISEELGVAPSTVTCRRNDLGFPSFKRDRRAAFAISREMHEREAVDSPLRLLERREHRRHPSL